jgi:biotin carboxyl carrier protein
MIVQLEIDGRVERAEVFPDPNTPDIFRVRLRDRELTANVRLLQPGVLSLILENRSYRCILLPDQAAEPDTSTLLLGNATHLYRLDDPRSLRTRRARAGSAEGPQPLKASMPGRVLRLLVHPGAQLEAKQPILVIEAMKMQNELRSPKPGRLAELRVSPGDTVASGQILAVVE